MSQLEIDLQLHRTHFEKETEIYFENPDNKRINGYGLVDEVKGIRVHGRIYSLEGIDDVKLKDWERDKIMNALFKGDLEFFFDIGETTIRLYEFQVVRIKITNVNIYNSELLVSLEEQLEEITSKMSKIAPAASRVTKKRKRKKNNCY